MANVCKLLRDAFFGHNKEAVFAAFPELSKDAFGAAKAELLIPFAQQYGIVPEGELRAPEGAYGMRLRIGKEDEPFQGPWMDHVEPLPASSGTCMKAAIVATCIIIGNRYGCCWFAGWLTESVRKEVSYA